MGAPEVTSQYREWPLAGAERVIQCRWEQRIDGRGPRYVQRVLPDGCADVVVTNGFRADVVGPTGRADLPELTPGSTLVGLRVRTEAIRAVFGMPGYELRDRSVPLDEVLGPSLARRLVAALWAPGEAGDVWLGRWLSGAPIDGRVAAAVSRLRGPAGADVAGVAGVVGLSCRQLRRVVETESGLGPKTLQRIGRLQRFLRLADRADSGGLSQWAAMAGYTDQAHLAKDVTEFAATTPARLLAERRGGPSLSG